MRYFFIITLLAAQSAFAQCKDYIISVRGDTLNCTDYKGLKQGPWVISTPDIRGERGFEEQGFFEHGRREGTWRRFSLEGDLLAVENYRWGQKSGQSVYYNQMGDVLRQEAWRAVNPDNPYDTVAVVDPNNPNKVLRYEVIKVEGHAMKHGTWKFFDPATGTIAKTEEWQFDKPAPKPLDDLAPLAVRDTGISDSDSTGTPKPVVKKKPAAILEYEKKNQKKKIKVRDGSTGG